MNAPDKQSNHIERLLKQTKLPEPSGPLKNRVIEAAQKNWNTPCSDVPWPIPLRRLAISIAATLILTSGANYFSDWTVARMLRKTATDVRVISENANTMPGLPEAAGYRIWTDNRPTTADPQQLLQYFETVRQLLQEESPDDPIGPTTPANGRSQGALGAFGLNICS